MDGRRDEWRDSGKGWPRWEEKKDAAKFFLYGKITNNVFGEDGKGWKEWRMGRLNHTVWVRKIKMSQLGSYTQYDFYGCPHILESLEDVAILNALIRFRVFFCFFLNGACKTGFPPFSSLWINVDIWLKCLLIYPDMHIKRMNKIAPFFSTRLKVLAKETDLVQKGSVAMTTVINNDYFWDTSWLYDLCFSSPVVFPSRLYRVAWEGSDRETDKKRIEEWKRSLRRENRRTHRLEVDKTLPRDPNTIRRIVIHLTFDLAG